MSLAPLTHYGKNATSMSDTTQAIRGAVAGGRVSSAPGTAGRVRENWERIKTSQEGREGVFHDVPESLPALLYARKAQRRAAAVNFEYPDVAGALADLDDELAELRGELSLIHI